MIEARTAIVHDWFQGFHGSERVVETMRTGLFAPGNEPDVYTFHAARELLPEGLAGSIVQESRLARLPGVRQRRHDPGRWRYLLPLMPSYFDRLDLGGYDLVISSSHAFAARVRAAREAVHVCYCYTPLRYAWLGETDFGRATGLRAPLFNALGPRLRRLDREASTRPHGYVAISEAVRERIRRFYERDAAVIHPPVDVDRFAPGSEAARDGFLWVGRLVPYKQPQLVVEAFRELPYRLTMVGVGPLEERLRRALPPNVELRGWVERKELARLYAQARGFVYMGEEDFGIAMVEALAAGTPVLALARGGAREIVRDQVDGRLLEEATVDAVRDGTETIATRAWDREALVARAREFSRELFLQRFEEYVATLLERRRHHGV